MPLHIGLVGLGDAGGVHARALAELDEAGACKWTAICSRQPDRVEAFRAANDVPAQARSYAGLDALLDAGVCDAVILATPDAEHVMQLRRCATRGVHTLIEKPLGTNRASARAALELARSCQTIVRVGYHLRHHPGHRLVREQRERLIGPLRRVDVHWACPDPADHGWRAAGQARFWSVAALGTHCIDLARWFIGAEPKRVSYLLDPPMAIDRSAELSLGFEHAIAHVGVSIAYQARSRLVLIGERGEIECRGTLGARGDGEIKVREHGRAARARSLEFTPQNPYRAQLDAFLTAIQLGATNDIDDALGNLAVLEAIDTGAMPVS
jgi:predicted dehydrogenase